MDVKLAGAQGGSSVEPENHMFVSLSTLSNTPEGIVGCVAFLVVDPRTDGQVVAHYNKSIDWEQQGRGYNFTKIQAIMQRSALARKSVTDLTVPVQLPEALNALARAYKEHNCVAVWATPLDLTVIRQAMQSNKIVIPWEHTDERDVVSVWGAFMDIGIAPEVPRHESEPIHVPLGEAAYSARLISTVYRGFRPDQTSPERILEKSHVPG